MPFLHRCKSIPCRRLVSLVKLLFLLPYITNSLENLKILLENCLGENMTAYCLLMKIKRSAFYA